MILIMFFISIMIMIMNILLFLLVFILITIIIVTDYDDNYLHARVPRMQRSCALVLNACNGHARSVSE